MAPLHVRRAFAELVPGRALKRQLVVGEYLMWPFGKVAISDNLKALKLKVRELALNKKQAMREEHRMRATHTDAFVSPRYSGGLSVSQNSSTLVQPPTP